MQSILKPIFLILAGALCHAQDLLDLPDPVVTYALQGATVHTGDGGALDDLSVIIEDGLIADLTRQAPGNARVLDLTGFHIYPGLIDALTSAGLSDDSQTLRVGQPPSGRQTSAEQPPPDTSEGPGLYPHVAAADLLPQDFGDRLAAWRASGILTVQVTPSKGIFKGQSAIVNLGQGHPDTLIVRSPYAMELSYFGLTFGRYPSSTMGVLAHIRQTFLDAAHYGQALETYTTSPRGIRRPETDRSLEALQPYSRGDLPVIFPANSAREIRRSLRLIREFDLKGIIRGGFEADQTASELVDSGVPVLFSLNLPRRPRDLHPDDEESLSSLRYRIQSPSIPARLRDAGVRFAFCSVGASSSDFLRGLRQVVEKGLDKDDALRAATLSAAEILGVDRQLGSIEAGKIANLVVASGDLFDPDSRILQVFVDGRKYDVKSASDPENNDDGASGIEGHWQVTTASPVDSYQSQMHLRVSGSVLSVTLRSDLLGTIELSDGTVDGGSFAFTFQADLGEGPLTISVQGTVEGDSMTGTAEIAGSDTLALAGSRVAAPLPRRL